MEGCCEPAADGVCDGDELGPIDGFELGPEDKKFDGEPVGLPDAIIGCDVSSPLCNGLIVGRSRVLPGTPVGRLELSFEGWSGFS